MSRTRTFYPKLDPCVVATLSRYYMMQGLPRMSAAGIIKTATDDYLSELVQRGFVARVLSLDEAEEILESLQTSGKMVQQPKCLADTPETLEHEEERKRLETYFKKLSEKGGETK